MKGKRILYISSEVIPYMPQTEIATMTYSLPKLVNENGGQTRIFIPKYGIINERRHQLHEVIRLSGINLIINDMDMPLILKVASIPKERMQVYFIDSEDYFKDRKVEFDKNNKLYKDNDERSIFFAKGVIETIKKLNWIPDLVHVHGWIASFVPLYLKKYYNEDPQFENTKVIVSLYENILSGKMDKEMVNKLKYDKIQDKNLSLLENPTYENLYKISLALSDGVIFTSDIKSDFEDILKKIKIPKLECFSKSDYEKEYLGFYEKFLSDDK
jgi:starch synthase